MKTLSILSFSLALSFSLIATTVVVPVAAETTGGTTATRYVA